MKEFDLISFEMNVVQSVWLSWTRMPITLVCDAFWSWLLWRTTSSRDFPAQQAVHWLSRNSFLFIAMHHFSALLTFLIKGASLLHFEEFDWILAEILTTLFLICYIFSTISLLILFLCDIRFPTSNSNHLSYFSTNSVRLPPPVCVLECLDADNLRPTSRVCLHFIQSLTCSWMFGWAMMFFSLMSEGVPSIVFVWLWCTQMKNSIFDCISTEQEPTAMRIAEIWLRSSRLSLWSQPNCIHFVAVVTAKISRFFFSWHHSSTSELYSLL